MDQTLKILCFGDSLTEGYHNRGLSFSPYSAAMLAKLKKTWPERNITVDTDGVSGDLITSPPGGFKRRMERRYRHPEPNYDWVIFLGGTNDLGWDKSITKIRSAITEISDIALSHGAKVLLMTVPECSLKHEEFDRNRNELNDLIRNDARENVFVFDFHAMMPFHSISARERVALWDDGLHLTPKGYEAMGEAVAERLIGILNGSEGADASTALGGDSNAVEGTAGAVAV